MKTNKRKLAANRANAQKSTGPRSAEGKEKVAQNSVRHGLCGRFRVLPYESQEDYDNLLAALLESEQPANEAERELVVKMARHSWLSHRAAHGQEHCFQVSQPTKEHVKEGTHQVAVLADLDLYIRYQVHNDRAYARAAAELAKRRKERELAERGFASQKRQEAEEQRRAAAEQRREKQQAQRDERHQAAVALDQKRLEMAHMKAIQLGYDVSELFRGLSPEDIALINGSGLHNKPRQTQGTAKAA